MFPRNLWNLRRQLRLPRPHRIRRRVRSSRRSVAHATVLSACLAVNLSRFLTLPPRAARGRPLLPLVAACALALAGCGRQSQRADLVFINAAEPETLDPALMTFQLDQRLAYALFEGLATYDAAGNPQPGVAENWDISADGLSYTFHLRHNAVWSDGRPVTAQDFVASWRRTLLPETAAEYAYPLYYLKNGKAFNEGTLTDFAQVGVRAPDDWTLAVTLENPTPFFLGLTCQSMFLPVPVAVIDQWGDAWTKPEHIVTNGAFLLTTWRLNDKIRLTKNPRYWNAAAVRLSTIDVLPISRPNTALNFFASDLADLMMDKSLTPPDLVPTLRREPYFHAAPYLGTYFLRFNCQRPPFNDPRVRQAFALVVDKAAIVQKITQAGELPADAFVPPGVAGYESPPGGLKHDPERARALLAAAGFPGGRGFPDIAFLYNEFRLNEVIGVELQSMFQRELGIHLGLRRQENKVYNRTLSATDYDLACSNWIGDYNDPNTFLDMWVAGGGNNRTGWTNATYDGWIEAAAREPDNARRMELFRQAERMLVTDAAPICPVYFYVGIQIYDAHKLGGIEANLLDEHPLRVMYRKE
ncbi:MAG: peptide ABC transporter substrate-binding protein [Verrucomicrobia bacterium]|nr:peptide ABC transporter substrate-binding protein [Verrucomicrobiota bacterium]